MTDSTSHTSRGTDLQDVHTAREAGVPIGLVRGNASPEELTELIAVVMVLTTAGNAKVGPGESDPPSQGQGTQPRSRWNSPARMVRTTLRRGPRGWRASAAPHEG